VKISVVTISYNQARYLEQAIRSVVNQSYRHYEYIVVDAGSADGSRDLLQVYKGNIDHLLFEPDEGPADGLNKGFSLASGEIFAYINADDYFEPNAFAHVVNFFQDNPTVDVLCGAIRIADEYGRAKIRGRTSDLFDVRKYAAGICTIGQQATFIRSRAFRNIGGFNPANKTCWDGELLVDLALAGSEFRCVRKVLGNFRLYGSSITGSGRLKALYDADRERIRRKMQDAGCIMYSHYTAAALRVLYKLNVFRHVRYLTVK
jgi:glycosyltransferase involved in cell wall biosynthesis